jgi:hydrogenase expression/formation protein HypC
METWGDGDLINGRVDFGGVTRDVCLSYVPDVRVGEYVIIHVGFAISKVDEEEAMRTLEILGAMGDLVAVELSQDTVPASVPVSVPVSVPAEGTAA